MKILNWSGILYNAPITCGIYLQVSGDNAFPFSFWFLQGVLYFTSHKSLLEICYNLDYYPQLIGND